MIMETNLIVIIVIIERKTLIISNRRPDIVRNHVNIAVNFEEKKRKGKLFLFCFVFRFEAIATNLLLFLFQIPFRDVLSFIQPFPYFLFFCLAVCQKGKTPVFFFSFFLCLYVRVTDGGRERGRKRNNYLCVRIRQSLLAPFFHLFCLDVFTLHIRLVL